MTFAKRDKFDSPSYSECFTYLYNLDELALDSVALIVKRKFPHPLEHGFLYHTQQTRRAVNMFAQAIACTDLNLSHKEANFEVYVPNHFVRQLGLIQATPFPLFESLHCYTSWRIGKYEENGEEREESKRTIHFRPTSHGDIPLKNALKANNEAIATYAVWWNTLSANQWECPVEDEDVFRAIFSKGKIELDLEEDQRVLFGASVSEPTTMAKKLKQKQTNTPKKIQPFNKNSFTYQTTDWSRITKTVYSTNDFSKMQDLLK